MANRIILNETSYFGYGARSEIVNEIKKRNFKKALLVTDKSLIDAGVTKMVMDTLDGANVDYVIFDGVKPNPTIDNVHEGLKVCNDNGTDYIIAVGGGSVIDTAKAIGIVKTNPEFMDVRSLEGTADTKNKALPIIALPTTAGTGAEVTINYVITDPERVVKLVCVDPNDIPVLSIIDSELMAGMPKSVAAATGMDALTHAMEGYITKAHWDMTDMFHLKAINMIYHNIEKAVIDKDPEAMTNMGIAQYIAGMGFSNVGLGIVHSMAHQLGATYDVAHGMACSLFLPYIMEWNGEVCGDRFIDIGLAMGLNVSGAKGNEAVRIVVRAIRELETRLEIKQHMSEVGAKLEDIDTLAEKALADPCTGGNPREVTKEDLVELFKKAY